MTTRLRAASALKDQITDAWSGLSGDVPRTTLAERATRSVPIQPAREDRSGPQSRGCARGPATPAVPPAELLHSPAPLAVVIRHFAGRSGRPARPPKLRSA